MQVNYVVIIAICCNQKLLEDEVEMPDFNGGEVVANSTDEENNSADGDNTVLSTRQLQKYGPRSVRNEQVRNRKRISEALLHSKESASASHATCSKANTSGIWKAKPRFSLASVLRKSGDIGHSISNIESLPEIVKAVDPRASANLDGNHLEDDDRIEINSDIAPAETEAFPHGFNLAPMADLFYNLQDKADQETVINSEDSPEPVDSGSSSDKEVSGQHKKITYPGKKMQTMAERFEEALGTSSVITEGTHVGALNSLRPGIFGKLQQMMLKEKETDMDFWKKLQAEARIFCYKITPKEWVVVAAKAVKAPLSLVQGFATMLTLKLGT
eukprot:XP_014628419.1 uncharacterized protein LOC100777093 isoform X2 [Glycine max]